MQEDQLLAGSLADNITFFDQMPDWERLRWAAEMACLAGDIRSMPMAYHSLVGELGTNLSGGQKQRVLLARALYRRPKLLFLDEGTAHLDVPLERQIGENIKALGITRVIVAHRPHTIRTADRVIVIYKGHAVELEQSKANPTLAVA
jgi:ATP-binding cassette subfamily B protein RaxB